MCYSSFVLESRQLLNNNDRLPYKKRDQKKKEAVVDTIPFYNGTYVGVDIYGIGSKMLGGDFMSSEVSIGVNLKNKFIPTIEFGMGGTDTWNETGIHYKSKTAPFFRIGVDYNTMAKKKEKKQLSICRSPLCVQFIQV